MNQNSSPSTIIGPQCLLALKALHESIGMRLQRRISGILDERLIVELQSFGTATAGDFLCAPSKSSCCFRLALNPLPNCWYLRIERSLAYHLIDSALGLPQPQTDGQRELSELEWRLLKKVSDFISQEMECVWNETAELSIRLDEPLMHLPPPQSTLMAETSLNLCWQTRRQDESMELGSLQLCLPCSSLTPLHAKLLRRYSQFLATLSRTSEQPQASGLCSAEPSMRDRNIPTSLSLAPTAIAKSELESLQIGDILMTEHLCHQAVQLLPQGFGVYEGRLGAVDGMKAAEITLTPEESVAAEDQDGN